MGKPFGQREHRGRKWVAAKPPGRRFVWHSSPRRPKNEAGVDSVVGKDIIDMFPEARP